MDQVWFYSVASILLVSLVSLTGIIFLAMKASFFERIQSLLIAFAIGSLLGGAVLHLIPESLHSHHQSNISPLLVLASILAFFVLEKYFHVKRHYHPAGKPLKSFGPLNLVADGMHNFLDGILIAAAYNIDIHTGIIATIAIVAHEIPQEIGDFAVLVQAGYTKKKALLFNLLSASFAFIGGVLFLAFPYLGETFSVYVLPLAAGGFIYIALADLIPELNVPQSWRKAFAQVVSVMLGLLLMWLLLDNHSLHH
ncbi:MAG: ZIP family metal transporter [Bacteroidales bacterium]|nr:ZIP family metal transporter [Bacteroidales bacterium]